MVSDSLNHFWIVVNSVCLKITHKSWIIYQLIIHVKLQIPYHHFFLLVKSGQSSRRISVVDISPQDPMVVLHIGRTSHTVFTRLMWAVFSLIHWTGVAQCVASGGTQSELLTTSRPFDILPVCGILHYRTKCVTFLNFIAISGPGTSRLSFTEGDTLRYLISALELIVYQKPPPFLDFASDFSSLRLLALLLISTF